MRLRFDYLIFQGVMLGIAAVFFVWGVQTKERYENLRAELETETGALKNITAESDILVNKINLLGGRIGIEKSEIDTDFLAEKLREQGMMSVEENRILEENASEKNIDKPRG